MRILQTLVRQLPIKLRYTLSEILLRINVSLCCDEQIDLSQEGLSLRRIGDVLRLECKSSRTQQNSASAFPLCGIFLCISITVHRGFPLASIGSVFYFIWIACDVFIFRALFLNYFQNKFIKADCSDLLHVCICCACIQMYVYVGLSLRQFQVGKSLKAAKLDRRDMRHKIIFAIVTSIEKF